MWSVCCHGSKCFYARFLFTFFSRIESRLPIFATPFNNFMTLIDAMAPKPFHRSTLIPRIFHVFLWLLLSSGLSAQDIDKAALQEGKSLFKSNCASCHNPLQDGTGPALKGALSRWEAAGEYNGKSGKEWLHSWIKNWNDPVNAKYPYAVEMSNWSASQMNLFPTLKDEDIDKILLYVDNSDKGAAPAAAAAAPAAGTGAEGAAPEEGGNMNLWLFLAFLIALVAILVNVTNRLDRMVAESKGEELAPEVPFWKSKRLAAFLILIGVLYLGYVTADSAISLGREQGYQPEQPIKFSHALHAGKHKIDCQYCHASAAKGKHSNIPSLNTCMNCHKNVQKGPKYGTEEIAKIYAAVGYNPATQTYDRAKQKPVEWVRIHNLPDHVYFNHAQHVNAGKVACQTCHGPVETMEEVYQYSPLSMGWCINCHRQTEVQFASNNYYSVYEKLHNDLKNKKLDKVTVETIGGTECQKCHY